MAYIYKITNSINDKVYIGQTRCSLSERWSKHKTAAINEARNGPIQKAIREYGVENFSIEIIEECPNEISVERETYWISVYNSFENGYNGNIGGDGLHVYDKSEIYKLWDKGLTCKEIREIYGMDKQTLREILKQYQPFIEQQESRHALSRSRIKSRARAVKQYSLDGIFIREYPSITEASKITGAQKMAIVHSCQENFRIAKGYRWKYVNMDDEIPFKKRKVPVGQYDSDGNLLNSFESLADATRRMNLNISSLSQAVKRGVKYKGYMWKTL